jgi:hypothetical protein
MPIEIRELHIKVAVNARPAASGGTDASSTARTGDAPTHDIVAECVEQVLRVLHNREER